MKSEISTAADEGSPCAFAVVGAHGGAGASTVAAFLNYEQPVGTAVEFDLASEQEPDSGSPATVLVARSTAYGLKQAMTALEDWRLAAPWLVVVSDAPTQQPMPVRYRLRLLEQHIRGIVTMPYLYRMRSVDSPGQALQSRSAARAAKQLYRDLTKAEG